MIAYCATGDSLIREHFPSGHPGKEALREFISTADVRITNLETVLSHYQYFANSFSGGGWVTSPASVVKDLVELGFNYFSCANNHSMDFSYKGLESTMKVLRSYEVHFSGIGMSLTEASQPAFVQTPEGRVAVFSQAALYEHQYGARAGDSHDGIPPRPGLNILRRKCGIALDPQQFQVIAEIADVVGLNPSKDGSFNFDNRHAFVLDKECYRFSRVNEKDVERMEKYICGAKNIAAQTVVCFHGHPNKNISAYREEIFPDDYLEEYAHRCIDAGAVAVVGTGCHRLRGIEIYKGKPIFYSLGNFIFHSKKYAYRVPSDYFDLTPVDSHLIGPLAIAASESPDANLDADECYYRSILPYWEINEGKVTQIKMMPLDLNKDDVSGKAGFPSPGSAEKVMEDLIVASAPYGTKFYLEGDSIYVDLSEEHLSF